MDGVVKGPPPVVGSSGVGQDTAVAAAAKADAVRPTAGVASMPGAGADMEEEGHRSGVRMGTRAVVDMETCRTQSGEAGIVCELQRLWSLHLTPSPIAA